MSSETINRPLVQDGNAVLGNAVSLRTAGETTSHMGGWITFALGALDQEALFQYERAAFLAKLPALEREYGGRFVAIHRGSVVDSDVSQATLVRRFFERFGDIQVYIGYVGRPPVANQLSPFTL